MTVLESSDVNVDVDMLVAYVVYGCDEGQPKSEPCPVAGMGPGTGVPSLSRCIHPSSSSLIAIGVDLVPSGAERLPVVLAVLEQSPCTLKLLVQTPRRSRQGLARS